MRLTRNSLLPVPVSKPSGHNRKDARIHQGIPGIEKLPSGRLLTTWYAGGSCECRENYVLLAVSDDDGKNWQEVPAVIDPPDPDVRAFDAALWLSPDNKLYWFWAQGCGGDDGITGISDEIFDGLVGVWFVIIENPDDAPENFRFTAPRRISDGIMLNKPTVLRDGTWALPCSLWSIPCAHRDFHRALNPTCGALMVVSGDQGGTFSMRGLVDVAKRPVPPSFDEHQFLELNDGRLACYIRGLDGIGVSYSADHGKSWSDIERTDFPGVDTRFHIRKLASGRILLITNNSTECREKLTAFLSEDEKMEWKYQLMIDVRAGDSYPDAIEDRNHNIYIVHDRNRTQGGYIYLSRISEEDIMRGTPGNGSFLCREISRSRNIAG